MPKEEELISNRYCVTMSEKSQRTEKEKCAKIIILASNNMHTVLVVRTRLEYASY
jgi:hypothetical protein